MKKIIAILLISLVAVCAFASKNNSSADIKAFEEHDIWGTAAYGEHGAAACANPIAAQIGVQILEQGGNAVDAAVAMIYAVGLLEPAASGIGGCGQMLVYLADQNKYINIEYLTQVPSGAEINKTDLDDNSNPPSVETIAIPGLVHGTMTALEKYGTMTPRQVLQPVIDLAREGFELPARWNDNVLGRIDNLSAYEYSLNLYTDEGFMWPEGEIITNNDLADTLELIADGGKEAFYDSDFTDKMVDYIDSIGGILKHEDFANYETVIREPISTTYRGYTVYTVSAPSKGGVGIIEALNVAENFPINTWKLDDPTTLQIIAEAFSLGSKDGSSLVSDPKFYNLPIDTLISKEYAAKRAALITPGKKRLVMSAGNLKVTKKDTNEIYGNASNNNENSTTHLAVMDSFGNVVSTTNTNGHNFGSAVAVPGTGFCFNAHLGLFDGTGLKKIDILYPTAKTSSTICPNIVADSSGKPVLAIGSPGDWCTSGSGFQGIIYYIDFQMDVAQIVNSGRTFKDTTTPKDLYIDSNAYFSQSTIDGLKKMGFNVIEGSLQNGYSAKLGSLAAVEYKNGMYYAAGDQRRYYGAAAY